MSAVCEQISVRFGEAQIFNRLSCTFDSDVGFIVGENGTGKSLLLWILAGLHHPDSGRVRFAEGVTKPPALLMQEPLFFNQSVRKNLGFALRAESHEPKSSHPQFADEVLQEIGLAHCSEISAKKLSGGQKKMLNFARLMLMRRGLWLLDEPTAMLSAPMKHRIETLITKRQKQGTKMIIVTHEAAQVKRLAQNGQDRIVFLYHGNDTRPPTEAAVCTLDDFFKNPPNRHAQEFIDYYQ